MEISLNDNVKQDASHSLGVVHYSNDAPTKEVIEKVISDSQGSLVQNVAILPLEGGGIHVIHNAETAQQISIGIQSIVRTKVDAEIQREYEAIVNELKAYMESSLLRGSYRTYDLKTGKNSDAEPMTKLKEFAKRNQHAQAYHQLGTLHWIEFSGTYPCEDKVDPKKLAEAYFIKSEKYGYGSPGDALYDLAELFHTQRARNQTEPDYRETSPAYKYYVEAAGKENVKAKVRVAEYQKQRQLAAQQSTVITTPLAGST